MPTLADNHQARAESHQPQKVGALLLCGGRGQRLGIGAYKALASLAGKPLFLWSLAALERAPEIDGIVVSGAVQPLQATLRVAKPEFTKIIAWCEGGRTRPESVALGLKVLPAEFTVVAIHDSARPFVSTNVISRVVRDALKHGAAITAVPLDDTLKQAVGQIVLATVPRTNLWRAQTPQVFRRDWLEAAYAHPSGEATDDAMLVEAHGHAVFITPGESGNFKITTLQDLELAERYLTKQGRTDATSGAKPPNLQPTKPLNH